MCRPSVYTCSAHVWLYCLVMIIHVSMYAPIKCTSENASLQLPSCARPSLCWGQETVEKAKLSKLLIESHYTNMQRDRKDRLMRRKTLEHQVPPFMCLCMCWLNEPLYAAFGLFRGTSAQPLMRALS